MADTVQAGREAVSGTLPTPEPGAAGDRRCGQCGKDREDSVSAYFCRPLCQRQFHESRSLPILPILPKLSNPAVPAPGGPAWRWAA